MFDCSGIKMYKELDALSNLVPRIVKAAQPRYRRISMSLHIVFPMSLWGN